ncbi:hypothetical protein RCL1_005192 [Eukaryota sp. TZLM3-RCL]
MSSDIEVDCEPEQVAVTLPPSIPETVSLNFILPLNHEQNLMSNLASLLEYLGSESSSPLKRGEFSHLTNCSFSYQPNSSVLQYVKKELLRYNLCTFSDESKLWVFRPEDAHRWFLPCIPIEYRSNVEVALRTYFSEFPVQFTTILQNDQQFSYCSVFLEIYKPSQLPDEEFLQIMTDFSWSCADYCSCLVQHKFLKDFYYAYKLKIKNVYGYRDLIDLPSELHDVSRDGSDFVLPMKGTFYLWSTSRNYAENFKPFCWDLPDDSVEFNGAEPLNFVVQCVVQHQQQTFPITTRQDWSCDQGTFEYSATSSNFLTSSSSDLPMCSNPFTCRHNYDGRSSSSADAVNHMTSFRHVCRFGSSCLNDDPNHHRQYIHLELQNCKYGNACNKLGEKIHRCSYNHNEINHRDFKYLPYLCTRRGPGCQTPQHAYKYAHWEVDSDTDVIHLVDKSKKQSHQRKQNNNVQKTFIPQDQTVQNKTAATQKQTVNQMQNQQQQQQQGPGQQPPRKGILTAIWDCTIGRLI